MSVVVKKKVIDKEFGSIMILVPHQDDEILMSAGIIEQAVQNGLDVKVVMVTNGDYGSNNYDIGRKRLSESMESLECLGLEKKNFILLGYADTGMPREESFLTKLYETSEEQTVWKSHCSDKTYGLEDYPEYHFLKYHEHADYTKKNCYEDIKSVIEEYMPDNIFTTSVEDTHGDHSALFLFVKDILKELKAKDYTPDVYSGVIHSKAGDEIWPERSDKITMLSCPNHFDENSTLKWDDRIVFEVPQDMQEQEIAKNRKAIALSKHKTALKPDAVEFLYSFVKADEIFWKIN